MMDERSIEKAAELLRQARINDRRMDQLPEGLRPSTTAEGFKIQEALVRLTEATVGGWKIGGAGPTTTFAPIYTADIYHSDATIKCPPGLGVAIEGEMGFRLKRNLPPMSDGQYSVDAIIDSIGEIGAVMELVASRFAESVSIPEKVADNLGNRGLILGDFIRAWQALNLREAHVSMAVNGRAHFERHAVKPGKASLDLLGWAANNITLHGGLRAGQIIVTGSWTGLYQAKSRDEVHIRFADLGDVQVRIS